MRKIYISLFVLSIIFASTSVTFAVQDPAKTSSSPFQFLTNLFIKMGIIAPEKATQAQTIVNTINTSGTPAINDEKPKVSNAPVQQVPIQVSLPPKQVTPVRVNDEGEPINTKNTDGLQVTLKYPIGGETFEQGQGLPVLWNANNLVKKISVSILDINGNTIDYPHSTELLPNNSSAQSIGFSTKDANHVMPLGKYRAKICFAGTSICDVSKEPFSVVTADVNVNPKITNVSPQPVKPGQSLVMTVNNAGRSGNIIIKTKDGKKTWNTAYAKDVSYLNGWSKYDGEKMTITIPSVIGRGVHPDGWWNEPQVPLSDGEYYLYINTLDANSEYHTSNYVVLKVSGSGNTNDVSSNYSTVKLLPTTIDKAGIWTYFTSGKGNGNTISDDWNWVLNLKLDSTKTIKRITLIHDSAGEVWSTGYSRYLGNGSDLYGYEEHPYPLVVTYNGNQLNTVYDQTLGTYNAGIYEFKLFGQKESTKFAGGEVTVEFTDGTKQDIAVSSQVFNGYIENINQNTQPSIPVNNNGSNSNVSVNQTEDYLTVLTPVKSATGQNVFNVGDVINIRWSSKSLGITKITLNQSNNASQMVLYSSNNGAPYTGNSYSWIIPKNQLNGYYTVTVTLGNNYKSATSGQFRIINDNYPPVDTREYPDSQIPGASSQNNLRLNESSNTDTSKTVVVLTPVSAMNTTLFYMGDKMKIAWNSVGYDRNHVIKLVPSSNTSIQSVVIFDNRTSGERGLNPYTWTVPANVTSGKYKINVEAYNSENKSISGTSEGVITIINSPSPYITPAPSNSQEMQQAPTSSVWDAIKSMF